MFIYKITNKVNGKIYIGLDSGSISRGKRWSTHKGASKKVTQKSMIIHKAMAKYGIDNFSYEIIEICESIDALKAAEAKWIDSFNSNNYKFGYNRTKGGDNNWWSCASEEHKDTVKKYLGNCVKNWWTSMTEIERDIVCERRRDTQKTIYSEYRQTLMQAGKAKLDPAILAEKYKKAGEATAKVLAKSYQITDPDGNIQNIVNLRDFCRNNNLTVENMRAVLKGKSRHHKGWTCNYLENNIPIEITKQFVMIPQRWIFTSPDGNETIVENLKLFCKENDLPYWSLNHLKDIKTRTWKGWTLVRREY